MLTTLKSKYSVVFFFGGGGGSSVLIHTYQYSQLVNTYIKFCNLVFPHK